MKCTIPEISWHNREPVLSVDVHPNANNSYKLATAGGDCHVVIWQMKITENGAVKQELVSELTRHQRSVNVVRWSPDGKYLASGDDDANIIIWQQKTDDVQLVDKDSTENEVWVFLRVLRGHKEDVYDLCWSPDGKKLLSGSIDNTAMLWDLSRGKYECILTEHKGFVQGVAWDPKGSYFATISTDRNLRIFDSSGKQVKARVSKGLLPVPDEHYLYKKEVKYFHDDTFKSFFRRLHFSPDGSLLIVPSGRIETDESKKALYATYMFAVEDWSQPVGVFPSPEQCSIAVRCCPLLFELREDGPEPTISLPYRMVIAVATERDVVLYDTQQVVPFARCADIHYTRLTDLTWSADGRLLVVSSTDGFCTLITFDAEELGLQYYMREDSELEINSKVATAETSTVELPVAVQECTPEKTPKKKKPTFLEEWAMNAKKIKLDKKEDKANSAQEKVTEVTEVIDITEDSSQGCDNNIVKQGSEETKSDNSDLEFRRITLAPVKNDNETVGNEISVMSKEICEDKGETEKVTSIPVKSDDEKITSNVTSVMSEQNSASDKENKRSTPVSVECNNGTASSDLAVVSKQQDEKETEKKRIKPIPVTVQEEKRRIKPIPVTTREEKKTIKPIPITIEEEKRIQPMPVTTQEEKTIKPIPVTTKKRITPVSMKGTEEQSKFKFKNVEAKPIAVRRKPKENSEKDTSVQQQHVPSEKMAYEEPKAKDISITENDKSPAVNDKTETPPKPSSGGKSRHKQKEKHPVSRSNSLLKFLKPVPKKATSQKSLFGKPSKDSECIVIEDEARDAWKCDKMVSSEPTTAATDKNLPQVEDDSTEDFHLQLEDSTQGTDNKIADQSNLIRERDTEHCAENHSTENKATDDSKKTTVQPSVVESTVTDSVVGKTVRNRVPLITLSSPKNKKKQ